MSEITDDRDDVRNVQDLGKAALKIIGHPKFHTLSAGAGWLWLRVLTILTAGNGTLGGVLTDAHFKQVPGATAAKADELVAVGLWRRDLDGWRMRRMNAKAPPPATAVVAPRVGTEAMRFTVIGGADWILTEEQIATWQATYVGLEVRRECGYAHAWVEADTHRRKTARGMAKFLVRWLSIATDRGHRSSGGSRPKAGLTGPAPAGKYDHLTTSDELTH